MFLQDSLNLPSHLSSQRHSSFLRRTAIVGAACFAAASHLIVSRSASADAFAGGRPTMHAYNVACGSRQRTRLAALNLAQDDPWRVLGVKPGSNLPVIKQAYRKLVNQQHPDVNPAPDARRSLEQTMKAYRLLLDAEQLLNWEKYRTVKTQQPRPTSTSVRTPSVPETDDVEWTKAEDDAWSFGKTASASQKVVEKSTSWYDCLETSAFDRQSRWQKKAAQWRHQKAVR